MTSRTHSLTQQRLKELLHYNPESGVFTWIVSPSLSVKKGEVCGGMRDAYLYTRIDGINHQLHRLAVLYMTGKHPVDLVDHWDGVTTNNRWGNLREATPRLNSENRRKARGYDWREKENLFYVRIRVKGKAIHLGTTPDEATAKQMYVDAKRLLHEGCTL